MKQYLNWAVAAAAALLSACPGGSGGGGGDGDAPGGTARSYHQTYITFDAETFEPRVTVVNRADFTDRREFISPRFAHLFTGERSGGVLRNAGLGWLFFIHEGHWTRLDLRGDSTLQPQQVSSEALADSCGDPQVIEQAIGSEAGAQLFYSKAGDDAECNTDDDEYLRIGVGDSPGTAPRAGIISGSGRFYSFRNDSGELLGVLAQHDDGQLRLYPPDFSAPTLLGTAGFLMPVSTIRSSGLFAYDNEMHYIDASGTVSPALHTLPGGFWPLLPPVEDDTYAYFTEGLSLYRVRVDGTADAQMISFGEYDFYALVGLTANSIVVAVTAGETTKVLLLDRATAAYTATLQEFPTGAFVTTSITRHAPLLYSTFDGTAVIAQRLDADDTLSSGSVDSIWSGLQFSPDWPLSGFSGGWMPVDPPVIGAFQTTNFTLFETDPETEVSLVDLASGARTLLVRGIDDLSFQVFATGADGMGFVSREIPGTGSYQTDVFSFDLDDHRFEWHTEGTPDHDFPYSF